MTLADRIDNWGRAMQPSAPRGRARSLEGLFRSPQPWDEPVQSYAGTVDFADAYTVELAWGSLPDYPRIILRGRFCLRWVTPQICRVAQRMTGRLCHPSDFEKTLQKACNDLLEALARDERDNRSRLRRNAQKMLAVGGGKVYN